MEFPELCVAVVEDHDFQRRMVVRVLRELGVRDVIECTDGQHALEALRAGRQRPDVAIVDLDLPKIDGIELIRHLAEERLARAAIIASGLEANLTSAVEHMAQAYGFKVLGNLEKPVTRERLARLLRKYESDSATIMATGFDLESLTTDEVLRALNAGEIVPHFQPQVDFSTGRIRSCEALVRWFRPGSVRPVPPPMFIPLLEREGLLGQLTDRCLEQVASQMAMWAMEGFEIGVSVNVSMSDLVDLSAADRYAQIVRQRDIKPSQITLEVTESQVMGQEAKVLNVLSRLRLKGFDLAIDDFGTGYSSLQQLSNLPVTELKVDGGFVRNCDSDARQRSIVESSLDLARRLKLRTVAEGVETQGEWSTLKSFGCDLAQGWLVAKAMSPKDFVEWAARYEPPAG